MTESFRVSATLPAIPERVYRAWLTAKEHAAFTGEPADVNARKGGRFTAGDGYISGKNLELEPHTRILQAWRTTEFPEGSEDSVLEVRLQGVPNGTRITLFHKNVPDGQGAMYQEGWREYYLKPMKAYFTAKTARSPHS